MPHQDFLAVLDLYCFVFYLRQLEMASKVKSDFRAELFLELDLVSPFSLRMSPRALFTLVGSRMPLAILDHIGTQATGLN